MIEPGRFGVRAWEFTDGDAAEAADAAAELEALGFGALWIRAPEYFSAIDQRNVVELKTPYPLRLNDFKQARGVQIEFGFRRQTTKLFSTRCPIAQLRDEGSGASGDHGEIFAGRRGPYRC